MIEVPLEFKIKGSYKLRLIDTRDNSIVEERGFKKNTLTNYYLNALLTKSKGVSWLAWDDYGLFDECHVGTGTTAPTRSDTALENELASNDTSEDYNRSGSYDNPMWAEKKFIFKAGTATGVLSEVGAFFSEEWYERMMARQLISPAITKKEYHQLEIIWRLELTIPQVSTGTITAGQRDGTTDINWRLTINNKQLNFIARQDLIGKGAYRQDDNVFATMLGCGVLDIAPKVIVGGSNSETDLENDGYTTIKGNSIYSGNLSFFTPSSYVSNSFERTVRIGFEQDIAVGSIGELLMRAGYHDDYKYTLFRITFDPPLDKQPMWRLYLDFKVKIIPE